MVSTTRTWLISAIWPWPHSKLSNTTVSSDDKEGGGQMRARIPWARILAEGVVIVVSILLAFGIDAWWDGRRDRAQSEALLRALLEDFRAAEVQLDTVESKHRRLVENGRRLIMYGENGYVPEAEHVAVDSMLGSHFLRPVYEPPMGTVESILGSGRLDLFENQALLASLTEWTASVASLRRAEIDARQHFYDRLYPYLSTRIDIEDLDKGFSQYPEHAFPFHQGETRAYELVADLELQNILYTHWVLGTNVMDGDIPRVRAALDRIRTETETELRR